MFDIKRNTHLLNPEWSEIKWNLAGLFAHKKFLHILISMMKTHGMLHALDVVHGCPDLAWNGRRINNPCFKFEGTAAYFKALNDFGIGVFLTFSNAVLEAKHLSDIDSNRLLECLDETCGLNGVIVVNDLMSDYIDKKKPGLKQVCSKVKSVIENPEGDLEWYQRMQARFDRVVVHTDHMFNLDLLDRLDRSKAEILVNEDCVYKCPNRKRHHILNSTFNLEIAEKGAAAKKTLEKIVKIKQNACAGGTMLLSEQRNPGHVRSCYLRHDEIKTIYDMGFRNFKIGGADKSVFAMAWDVIHNLFTPESQAMLLGPIAHQVDQGFRAQFKGLLSQEPICQSVEVKNQGQSLTVSCPMQHKDHILR